MIVEKSEITYAQYNEDIILSALLYDVKKGFYVDIGANYPVIDSVTKSFYEKGWHGINIEPLEELYAQLKSQRSRDINLNIGIGSKNEEKIFYENVVESGHSSFLKQKSLEGGKQLSTKKISIQTLEKVLDEYVKDIKINFMKIDVEGFEYEVIKGNNWRKNRPEIICIEANHIIKDWRSILKKYDYKLFIMDGLNEYYIARESWYRTNGFAERVIVLDYNSLKQHQSETLKDEIENYKRNIQQSDKLIKQQADELEKTNKIAQYSLQGKSYKKRLKYALYGLSLGWLKDKKNTHSSKE